MNAGDRNPGCLDRPLKFYIRKPGGLEVAEAVCFATAIACSFWSTRVLAGVAIAIASAGMLMDYLRLVRQTRQAYTLVSGLLGVDPRSAKAISGELPPLELLLPTAKSPGNEPRDE